jgi:hypothetical protein
LKGHFNIILPSTSRSSITYIYSLFTDPCSDCVV